MYWVSVHKGTCRIIPETRKGRGDYSLEECAVLDASLFALYLTRMKLAVCRHPKALSHVLVTRAQPQPRQVDETNTPEMGKRVVSPVYRLRQYEQGAHVLPCGGEPLIQKHSSNWPFAVPLCDRPVSKIPLSMSESQVLRLVGVLYLHRNQHHQR
jgi:hypothetical protein